MTDLNTEARQFLESQRASRQSLAERIQSLRDTAESVSPENRANARQFARRMALDIMDSIDRFDIARRSHELREYGRTLRLHANSPIRSYGDEYYSCCGLEDAQSELREWAAEMAPIVLRAAKIQASAGL